MTREADRWLLPEGVEEILPPQSWRLEALRARILELYRVWGYELVRPPLIEYLESLLTGTGGDLDLQTFKLTDQINGRMMGVRADITPQIARIDARATALRGEAADSARYCYTGMVLRTRPDAPGGPRCLQQAGVELFGHAGVESDLEVLSLMLETLRAAGIRNIHLDLGHVAIYSELVKQAELNEAQRNGLLDIVRRRALPDLDRLVAQGELDTALAADLRLLMQLSGDAEVIGRAREGLSFSSAIKDQALDTLQAAVDRISDWYPDLPIHIDLAELRGYRYQTGLVFAALIPGEGRELARGGRYNGIGDAFLSGADDRRSATGFSADLHRLAELGADQQVMTTGIWAPAADEPALWAKMRELRASGERVVCGLPGQSDNPLVVGCDRQLVNEQGEWIVQKVLD